MTTVVEIHCPIGPRRLFMKLRLTGFDPNDHVDQDNLMELACSDCRRMLRKQGQDVGLVLHYYNFLGEHVRSEVRA